ncbi:uncharacterized protein GGS25DRAFT_13345 [Hypoxylon fragiforme]|uniref:uncharacterized protein n=1 Tax=Hypoxylon fragiforme TaxID=63214 RepID=UPI0020C5BAA8|nr:uncharacterized protein GGS25DRAFT_13345 [Hypoxylon fragiforme]KAI2613744.1 hypothetical protein GGS25DRAFT_13345 [Hypoxylon fragiforme]
MTSLANKIKEAIPRNDELLATLSETDHALPSLEQQRRYVDDLNSQLSTIQRRISVLDKQRVKEFKEHKKYRDSVMKRFAYRVSGKTDEFRAKAEKEEREYFSVLQEERQAKEQEESLKAMRSKALEVQTDLEAGVARHIEAQEQLDTLYNSIFQGPTPAFPEEDYLEENLESALQAYRNSRLKMETEVQTGHLLIDAQTRLYKALSYTEEALSHSRMDMFGGGTFNDMMERNALDKADSQISQVMLLVRQAQRMSPMVQDLPPINIATGNLMGDVFFDNIFSDMAFHEKIKDSLSSLQRAGASLRDQIALAKSRYQDAEEEMNINEVALQSAREELQRARALIFERIDNPSASGLVITIDPPPY